MNTVFSLSLSLRVILPFALGYYLSYLFRTINSVIAPNLLADVGLNAGGLGLLTGAYFLSFAIFQLPLGVLLDRMGPRKTEALLLLLAALGSLFFALAESASGLVLARALIGVGVSACLMASFKAFVDWFPKNQLPLTNGLILMAGGFGAMSSTIPVEAALQVTGWREVFLGLATLSVVAAAAVYFIVPERPKELKNSRDESIGNQIRGMKFIIKEPVFYRYVPIFVLSMGTLLAVQSLWVGPWLRDVSGMDRGSVAETLFVVAVAMTGGYLVIGATASQFNKRGFKTETVAILGMIIFMLAQAGLIAGSQTGVVFLWCMFAFFGTSSSVIYAALFQHFEKHLIGRVSTMTNLLIFLCAFLMQWSIGVIINLFPTTADGGFSTAGYMTAYGVMLILQLIGLIWIWISQFFFLSTTGGEKVP